MDKVKTHFKMRTGIVVSNKMQKTIVVRVDRLVRHPMYEKVVRRSEQFKVHDEKGRAREGDWVIIRETRPLSRHKRWTLLSIKEERGTRKS